MIINKKITKIWICALSIAIIQNGIAVFAVYSSSQDRLSDGACVGGIFGTLGNIVILAVVAIWLIILAWKSFNMTTWHNGLKPLGAVAVSSINAILIGLDAALGCTV